MDALLIVTNMEKRAETEDDFPVDLIMIISHHMLCSSDWTKDLRMPLADAKHANDVSLSLSHCRGL
jgi:hypothetical protein